MRSSDTEKRSEVGPDGVSVRALLILVVAAVFVVVMNGSMTNVALPTIGDGFGASEGQAGWVITGYLLVFAVCVPLYGRLADVYSLKRAFAYGLLGFAVGSLVCALAPSLPVLVAGRMLQAAGGAAIPALSSTSVAKLLPPGQRGGALGLIVSSVGAGGAVGPVVGGFAVSFAGWHSLFYGTLALALLLLPVALRVLPDTVSEGTDASFDVLGGALLAFAAGLSLFGVTEGQTSGFSASTSWGSFVAAALCAFLFAWRINTAAQPFVSPRLFSNRAYLACAAVGFFGFFANLASLVLVPTLLSEVNGLGAAATGLVLVPGAVAIAFLSPLAGRLSDRTGTRLPILAGLLVMLVSLLALSAFGAGASPLVVSVGMLGAGIGFALFTSPNTNAAAATLPPQETGVGLGIYQMLFFLGGGFGPALTGAFLAARREDTGSADDALNPLYALDAAPFSDAFLLLALCALFAVLAASLGRNRVPVDGGSEA